MEFNKESLIKFLRNIEALESSQSNRIMLLDNIPNNLTTQVEADGASGTHIHNIVKYAESWGQLRENKDYALVVVMENARQFVENTTQTDDLDDLIAAFYRSKRPNSPLDEPKVIPIQIAVITMIKEEIEDLGSILDDSSEDPLRAALIEHGIIKKDLKDFTTECYHEESRHKWKPWKGNETIDVIISDVINRLEDEEEIIINPIYLSDKLLSRNRKERIYARKALRNGGGILIVDAMSMYNPRLRDTFTKSNLIGNPLTAMVIVPPLERKKINIYKLLEEQIYGPHLESAFYDFFEEELNPMYEFDVGGLCNLRRWLFSNLPKMHHDNPLPTSSQKKKVRRGYGQKNRRSGDYVMGIR